MTQPPKSTSTLGRYLASIAFSAKIGPDCIPDERMEEIVRRLIVSVEQEILSDIVRSEEPPQDKSKLWYQPSTKKLYAWSISGNKWEETSVDSTGCIAGILGNFIKKDEGGCFYGILSTHEDNLLEVDDEGNLLMRNIPLAERFTETITSNGSGEAEFTLTITSFNDPDAMITVMPLEDMGATMRWWVEDQDGTSATVKFAGLANATSYDIAVFAQQIQLTED